MPDPEKTVDMILDVLLKNVDKATLLKTVRELEEVIGDKGFREIAQRISERIQAEVTGRKK